MKRLIIENRIGAAIFGVLGVGGVAGIAAGNAIHVVTLAISALMCWALIAEAKKMERELNNE